MAPDPAVFAECAARDGTALSPALPAAERMAALDLSRMLGDQAKEVEVLNNLATAVQYLGRREEALGLFAEALGKAPGCDAWRFRDFILHHLGRCLVEMGRMAEARERFEAALEVRLARGDDDYAASTRRALAALG